MNLSAKEPQDSYMNTSKTYKFVGKKAIIHLRDRACESADELISSELFYEVVSRFVNALKRRQSPLLQIFGKQSHTIQEADLQQLIRVLQVLAKMSIEAVPKLIGDSQCFV